MHTFTINVQFSDQVLADAEGVAAREGGEAARHYLERMVDKAFDGGHFEHVEVEFVQN